MAQKPKPQNRHPAGEDSVKVQSSVRALIGNPHASHSPLEKERATATRLPPGSKPQPCKAAIGAFLNQGKPGAESLVTICASAMVSSAAAMEPGHVDSGLFEVGWAEAWGFTKVRDPEYGPQVVGFPSKKDPNTVPTGTAVNETYFCSHMLTYAHVNQ